MLEVYLLGVIVTLVKIIQMARVEFDSGFWSFCALMICLILVNFHFDLGNATFEAYRDDPPEIVRSAREASKINCPSYGLLVDRPKARCPHCQARLYSRKPRYNTRA